jgi:hypothetical protein
MKSEYDVIKAAIAIAQADTGAGGLVPLAGKSTPLVRFHDIGHFKMPIATIVMLGSTLARGTPLSLFVNLQFDAFVKHGSEGLDVQIIDRITEVMTTPNFKTEGLDAGVELGGRRMLSDLEDGRLRMSQDMTIRLAR